MRVTTLFFLLGFVPLLPGQSTGKVVFTGSIRSRAEIFDWFQGSANHSYAYSGNLLRLSLIQQAKSFDWQVDLAAPFLVGLPGDAVSTTGAQGQLGLGATYFTANGNSRNTGMVFAKQAFLRYKREGQSLRLGRFEFQDGAEITPKDATLAWVKRERVAQRLIGPFGWSDVGRSFDGAQYGWSGARTNLTIVAAIPTRGAFQTDGWGQLHAAVAYAALNRSLSTAKASGDFRAFSIYYQDWRHVLKTDNRGVAERRSDLANIRIATFGSHGAGSLKNKAGVFDALLWAVAQTGAWGRLNQRSAAVLAEAGWQPVMPRLKPWLRGGFSWTSGDNNPTDQTHGTFFQILPTPRPYARFPFFNMMNNQDVFGMLLLRPHNKLTVRSEAHGLRLTNDRDLWYSGGGAFQPWTFGYQGRATSGNRGLATLYDTSVELNASKRTAFTAYVGHAVGHSVMAAIYPQGKNATFGYLEILLKF